MKKLSMRNILIGFLVLLFSVLTIASAFAIQPAVVTLSGDGTDGKLYNDRTATCEYSVTGGTEPYNVHVELLDNNDDLLAEGDLTTASGELVYELAAGDASPRDVLTCEVTVVDQFDGSVFSDTITVENRAPTLSVTGDTEKVRGEDFTLTVTANDADSDSLTVTLSTNALDAGLTYNSGVISWLGSVNEDYNKETLTFTVTASDGNGGTVSKDVTLEFELFLEVSKLKFECSPKDGCEDEDVDFDFNDAEDRAKVLNNGDLGAIEVAPGTEVSFEVEVENLWDDDNDEIDVSVEVEMDEFADEGDFNENCDENVEGDNEFSCEFSFTVPLDAEDEDEQKLQFTIKGDEDGRAVDYLYQFTVTFNVNKPSHGVVVDRLVLSPGTVKCGELFTATAEVYNTGSDDEYVGLEVASAELEIDNDDLFQLEEEDGDGEGFAKRSYQFRVPSDAAEGQYLLQASAFYNNDKDVSDPALATLQVVCPAEEPETEEETEESESAGGAVIVDNTLTAQPELPAVQGGVVGVPVEEEVSEEGSFTGSTTYLVLLSVLAVLALVVLVALGATLLRKR